MIPLSFAQQRLWFIGRLEGPSPTYNVPMTFRLTGPLDRAALGAALRDVVRRHEVLRTLFREGQDGVPHQFILDPADADPRLEYSRICEAGLAQAVADCWHHSFDLSNEPPFRAWLFELAPDEHVLALLMHHIAADEWSAAPLNRDLADAYAARLAGAAPRWEPLPVQYRHYTLWQHELLSGEDDPDSVVSRQLRYWREALDALPEELRLPLDRPRPAKPSHQGALASFEASPRLHQALLDLARDNHTTLFMVLHAAVAVLLTRIGAGTDVPVGVPVAGRTDEALEQLIGFFVNTLVMRTDTSGDPCFTDLLNRVRETGLGAYENQDVPFERLVEVLNPVRSTARNPLFQVMLVLENGGGRLELPGLTVARQDITWDRAKFDLTFEFGAGSGEAPALEGRIEYATDLFDHRTVEQIGARLVQVLEAVAAEPGKPISEISVLLPGESADGDVASNTAWWIGSLTGAPAAHSLPRREGAAADVARSAARIQQEIDSGTLESLRSRCEELEVDALNVVHSALALAVCNLSYESDVVIGVSPAAAGQILPLRTTISDGDQSFGALVRADRERITEALRRTDFKAGEVLKACAPIRDGDRNALYQITLSFHDEDAARSGLDLIVRAQLTGDRLTVSWDYDAAQFSPHTIDSLVDDFGDWLRWGLARPDRPIRERTGTGADLGSPSSTSVSVHATGSVYERFVTEWQGRWEEPVFTGDGVELTAGQLHGRVAAMSDRLAGHGVGRGSVVACRSRKTLDHLLAFLAVSRLGAVHLPVDVASPPARTAAVLERCAAVAVVTDEFGAVPGYPNVPTTGLPDDFRITPTAASRPDALSHIVFTSGSTGVPKGVRLSNRSIDAHVAAARDAYGATGTTGAQIANPAYDFFIEELVLSILIGNRMAVLPAEQKADPAAFARFVERERIGVLVLATSYWSFLISGMSPKDLDRLRDLEVCLMGGEDYPQSAAQAWFKALDGGPRLFNGYGPAENNPASLAKELRPDTPLSVIGFPIGEVRCDVRSRFGSAVPTGGRGELWLSGPQLFAGYVGGEPVAYYPTGDIVLLRPEHGYQFVARVGSMMKISGFRVEAAEYTTLLGGLSGVADVRVQANADRTGVLIYCLVDGTAPEVEITEAVGRAIHSSLPQYMRRYELRFCREIPLTSNAKADFTALHGLSWPAPVRAAAAAADGDPDGLRAETRAAWRQVFGTDQLDEHRGFFDQGGTSMSMLRLQAALNERFEGCFELIDLYEKPSIALQAAHARERLRAADGGDGAAGPVPAARDRLSRKRQAARRSRGGSPRSLGNHQADMEREI